ncbi:hypothetical protein FA10DRAFT_262498 [Acaromyces ingoldii]|uniref:Uncharacterized protein n=1 Tax=Acaromyces ingoldii TaxID=215250 RepID=A0A316YC58_9BASI|nr:hypothetical protein FA10DRAFT_262498 [Acaromyces ingoldii]PWN87330.1 hypothetical protein FA10DRAFT_262498 [Acaromyces ingoldii]
MRLCPLFLVILCVWTTLLLLASSCQAVRTRFDLSGHERPDSYFLEPTSSDSGSENFEYDAQGRNKRAKNVSVRPSSKRQRGSSDPEADTDFAFLKKGDSDRWFYDAEKVSAGKVAQKASSSHGDRFKGAGDNYKEVTEDWARFKMVLAYRESGHDSNKDGLWDEFREINKFVDQMLGPPSTMNGDDLSRLNFTNVPFEEVNKGQKNFEDAFKCRIICGWATSDTDFIEGQWQISVVRPSLVTEQWLSRPEGFTDLIFFNVPVHRAKRVRDLITKQSWDGGKVPHMKFLFGGTKDKCSLRLRGKDEARYVYY